MQAPIFTDTEAETSVDMDISIQQLPQVQSANLTKSVFNITLANLCDEHESAAYRECEEMLEAEVREWKVVWKEAKDKLKAAQNAKHTVDMSVLPPHKRAYLEQAPNLSKFIRDSLEFREAANIYLEFDLAETMDVQENLNALLMYRTDTLNANAIKKCLANKSTKHKNASCYLNK